MGPPDRPPSPEQSDPLRSFLAGRDLPCPRCGYNLRGCASPTCPECNQRLTLTLANPARPEPAWIAGLIILSAGTGFHVFLLLFLLWETLRNVWFRELGLVILPASIAAAVLFLATAAWVSRRGRAWVAARRRAEQALLLIAILLLDLGGLIWVVSRIE